MNDILYMPEIILRASEKRRRPLSPWSLARRGW